MPVRDMAIQLQLKESTVRIQAAEPEILGAPSPDSLPGRTEVWVATFIGFRDSTGYHTNIPHGR